MIYVPMLKTRAEEERVAKQMNYCFSEKIIPLFEVICEKYNKRYIQDEMGEYIYKSGARRKVKIEAEPTVDDIITLQELNNIVEGKTVFIDYFRFSLKKYGRNIDLNKAKLSFALNDDLELYKQKLLDTTKYANMIPVISLKPDCIFPYSNLQKFVQKIQNKTSHIAVRITEEFIEDTKEIIRSLREGDYLLFDVEEQNPEFKFMEIQEVIELQAKCKIILLNSPRKLALKNGNYPEKGITDLICNCARTVAEDNDLKGYGDYCGLKDAMPMNDGSNGTGAALALFFEYDKNVFYSYCNHDTSLGMKGYKELIPKIIADEKMLNPDSDCPGYEKIHALPNSGNWNTWHHINAARYIYQVYKHI